MKYPLTETAKAGARNIVQHWDTEQVNQHSHYFNMGIEELSSSMFLEHFGISDIAVLLELQHFGLLTLRFDLKNSRGEPRIDILLLQELRNAVASDFDVSDYFITMNAVGNIIVNSTTGPVQGVGVNTGTVHQTVEQLADYIGATLGQDFLAANVELKAAIDELRTATTADQQSALGKVISQLGNSLHLGASTVTIVQALAAAAPFLQRLVGG